MSSFPIVVEAVRRPLTLFRGCHGSDQLALIGSMRSNYEAGRKPHPAERRAIVTFMAVSMFDSGEQLGKLASLRPDRIGTHIARVELRPGLGFCIADTGSDGHWSIWGLPDVIAECIVDVTPIDFGGV